MRPISVDCLDLTSKVCQDSKIEVHAEFYKKIFEDIGSQEGSTKVQGGFVIEKAFAEK